MNLILKSVYILISVTVCLSTAQILTTAGSVDYHTRHPAADNQFPYMVFIYMDFEGLDTLYQCGGVILSKNHVLTSASCFANSPNDTLQVNDLLITAGNNSQPDTTQVYRIINYDIMATYSRAQYINDLIMLQVYPDFNFTSKLSPIVVSSSWNDVSTICVLPTWYDGQNWDYLYWTYISQFDCGSSGTLLYCAGDPTLRTAVTTSADVGCAMVCNNKLVGLVTMNGEYQYLTNMTDHYNWIQERLGVATTSTSSVSTTAGTLPTVSTTLGETTTVTPASITLGETTTVAPASTTLGETTTVTLVSTTLGETTTVTPASTTLGETTMTEKSPPTVTETSPLTTSTGTTWPSTTWPTTTLTDPPTTVPPTTTGPVTTAAPSSTSFNALVNNCMLIFTVVIVTANTLVCINVM